MRRCAALFLLLLILNPQGYHGQVPELDDDDNRVYYGKNWGAAGIVDSLIHLSQSGIITDSQTSEMINTTIRSALDGIWEGRIQIQNGSRYPSWEKIAGYEIYPGQKYGSSGIIPAFLDAYHYFQDNLYLNWAQQSIQEIYLESEPNQTYPSWPYAYVNLRNATGISITDINFGSLGIIDASLDYYEVTNDSGILEKAVAAANWIDSVSYNRSINGLEGKILPWYATSTGEIENAYSAYLTGNAGAIPIFSRLSQATGNYTWQEWADFLTLWMLEHQKEDGRWTYTTESNVSDARTNFEEGVAGVVTALMQYQPQSSAHDVNTSILQASQWIVDQLITEDENKYFRWSDYSDYGYYGLYNGMLGILKILRVSDYEDQDLISSLYEWLLDHTVFEYWLSNDRLIGFVPSSNTAAYSELSLGYGLAGLMTELTDLVKTSYLLHRNSDLLELIESIVTTLVYYQQDNGLWPRQVAIPEFFNPNPDESNRSTIITIIILGSVAMIGLLLRLRKNKA